MIRSAECGVIPMIRRDHQKIILMQQRQEFAELLVKPLDLLSVSSRVPPMSP